MKKSYQNVVPNLLIFTPVPGCAGEYTDKNFRTE
jgi:hypothetical protein